MDGNIEANASAYRTQFRTSLNAPNLGEFNNARVTPYIEPDPDLERRFKNGLIIIDTSVRIQKANHRNYHHMGTKFDTRNDPAFHLKHKQAFALAAIVATGEECTQVASLDELQLVDENGVRLTQDWLDDQIKYLDGKKPIESLSSATSMHRMSQGQKNIDKWRGKLSKKHGKEVRLDNYDETKDRRKILDSLDKTMLLVSQKISFLKNTGDLQSKINGFFR